MPRTRPPSREEKDALAAAGPPAPWFCRKSPGSAVSVFSTMSLIAAARTPVAAPVHARPLPAAFPASVGTSCLFENEIFIRVSRGQTQCSLRERPPEGARVRVRAKPLPKPAVEERKDRTLALSMATPGSRACLSLAEVAALACPSYTCSSNVSLSI